MVALMPLPAVLILASREEKGGAKKLFGRYFRSFKFSRMIWYLPTILVAPILFILADRGSSLFSDIPELVIPSLPTLLIIFVMVFITGSIEEIAWMGYAYGSLEDKWKTIRATLILWLVWYLWHVPAFYFLHPSIAFMGIFGIFMLGWRFLMVWAYKNTGKSIAAAVLVHCMGNVALALPLTVFDEEAVGLIGVVVLAATTLIATLILIYLWSPELNKFRFGKVEQVTQTT
jgi:hypothetical protein